MGLANAEIMHGLIELFEIDATITEPLDPEFGRAHLLVPAGMQSADAEAIRGLSSSVAES